VWRAFETGVLDKTYLPQLMRPVVRYVTRLPVASNNPLTSPLPAIDALIEQHALLRRSHRQLTGDDETPAIGLLCSGSKHARSRGESTTRSCSVSRSYCRK